MRPVHTDSDGYSSSPCMAHNGQREFPDASDISGSGSTANGNNQSGAVTYMDCTFNTVPHGGTSGNKEG